MAQKRHAAERMTDEKTLAVGSEDEPTPAGQFVVTQQRNVGVKQFLVCHQIRNDDVNSDSICRHHWVETSLMDHARTSMSTTDAQRFTRRSSGRVGHGDVAR